MPIELSDDVQVIVEEVDAIGIWKVSPVWFACIISAMVGRVRHAQPRFSLVEIGTRGRAERGDGPFTRTWAGVALAGAASEREREKRAEAERSHGSFLC